MKLYCWTLANPETSQECQIDLIEVQNNTTLNFRVDNGAIFLLSTFGAVLRDFYRFMVSSLILYESGKVCVEFSRRVQGVDFTSCWDKTTLLEMQILHNFDIELKCSGWCWKHWVEIVAYQNCCQWVGAIFIKPNNHSSSRASTSGFNSHLILSWKDLKEKRSFDSEWRLFSEAKSSRPALQCDKYIWQFEQIHLEILTNTFCNLVMLIKMILVDCWRSPCLMSQIWSQRAHKTRDRDRPLIWDSTRKQTKHSFQIKAGGGEVLFSPVNVIVNCIICPT